MTCWRSQSWACLGKDGGAEIKDSEWLVLCGDGAMRKARIFTYGALAALMHQQNATTKCKAEMLDFILRVWSCHLLWFELIHKPSVSSLGVALINDMYCMKSMTGKQERKARPSVNLKKGGRKCTSADMYCMKNMTRKQERKARPRIIQEKEGKKCASAESYKVGSYNAPTREDHTRSCAILCLTEIDRRAHTCLMDTCIHVAHCRTISVMCDNGKLEGRKRVSQQPGLTGFCWNSLKELGGQQVRFTIVAGTQIGVPICFTRSDGRLRW